MVDLYNRARSYQQQRERVSEWPIHPENRGHIGRYLARAIDRLSPGRRYSDILLVKKLFLGTHPRGRPRQPPFVTKPLSALDTDDFLAIRARLDHEITNSGTYEKITSHLRNIYEEAFGDDPSKQRIINLLFRTGRRRFFRWTSDTPISDAIAPDKFYTHDEFTRMLRVATRVKERALLAVAWESTARPNEYLSLAVSDVEELPQGFKMRAHISKRRGHVPVRYLYIFVYRAEFNAYWRSHPFRDRPDAPLFYREDNAQNHGERLSPSGANKILKRLDRLSRVRKNGTLYFLRHGGYSWKRLQGMNPALAGRDMGWVPGGKEERRYLHLREDDLVAERLRLAHESATPEVTQPVRAKTCPFCHATNSPVDDRCATCGQTLSMTAVLKELAELRQTQDELVEVKLAEILAKHGLQPKVDSRPVLVPGAAAATRVPTRRVL